MEASTRREILEGNIDIASVFVGNQVPDLLSGHTRSDITQEIRRAIEDREVKEEEWTRARVERQRITEEKRIAEEIRLQEAEKLPVMTKLLPEIPITGNLYKALRSLQLPRSVQRVFERRARTKQNNRYSYVSTFGDLMDLSLEELVEILSSKSQVHNIAEMLQSRIGHAPQSEQDDIPTLLTQAWVDFEAREETKKQVLHMKVVRQTIQGALDQGVADPVEIQKLLIAQAGAKRAFKVSPKSWVALAMIEYILRYPESSQ